MDSNFLFNYLKVYVIYIDCSGDIFCFVIIKLHSVYVKIDLQMNYLSILNVFYCFVRAQCFWKLYFFGRSLKGQNIVFCFFETFHQLQFSFACWKVIYLISTFIKGFIG